MADRTDVREAERARFLAARYPQVQALRIVPWGVTVTLLGLTIDSAVTGPAWWVVLGLLLASIPATVVFTWLSIRHYRRRFGGVRRRPESGIEIPGAFVAFGLLAALHAVLRHTVGEGTLGYLGLIYAGILTISAWPMGRFGRPRLALAGPVAVASVLPLGMLTGSGTHPLAMSAPYPLMILGPTVIVIGLLEHWLVVRAFSRRPEPR